MPILTTYRRNIDLQSFRTSDAFYRLNETAQNIVNLLLLNQSIFISELKAHTADIKDTIVDEQAQTRQLIWNLAQQRGTTQGMSASYIQLRSRPETKVDPVGGIEKAICRWLLDSLSFSAMRNRQEEIAPAYHATFDWIFAEPSGQPDSPPWKSLVEWLRGDNNMFWINGKPGSGKSTLMKFIFNDRRTAEALSEWSGAMPCLVANFFFWNGGIREQRSQVGLLRSLLFQILQHRPSVASLVFPEEFERLRDMSVTEIRRSTRQPWTLKQLQGAVHQLIGLSDLPMKMCLFIDGLDEFEGNDEENDLLYLVEILKRVASSPFVKICASSRPLLVLERAFSDTPGLRLQDLTTGDIKRYVFEKLTRDTRSGNLSTNDPAQTAYFVDAISEKAQGVFLWVKLVVRSLLQGLGNHDRIDDLKMRLNVLPRDLEDLYGHMIMQVEPLYLQNASKIFQLIRTAREVQDKSRKDGQRTTPVTVLQLALAIHQPWKASAEDKTSTASMLSKQCDTMRACLQTWCAGLLEVPDFIWNRLNLTDHGAGLRTKISWEVAYMHRTARDFLEGPSISTMLSRLTANSDFEPHALLLKSIVSLYRVASPFTATPLGYGLFKKELLDPICQALIFAQRAEALSGDHHLESLYGLDHVAGKHLSRWSGSYQGHWSQFLKLGEVSNSYHSFMDVAIAHDLCGYVTTTINCEHRDFLRQVDDGTKTEDPQWTRRYFESYSNFWEQDESEERAVLTLRDLAGKGLRYYAKQREIFDSVNEIHPVTPLDVAIRPSFCNVQMVRILLRHGASPNDISGSERLWEHVLSRAQQASCTRKGFESQKWLQIIDLFLQYGVDIRGYNPEKWKKRDQDLGTARMLLLEVIDGFRQEHADDTEALRLVVTTKFPISRKEKMMYWIRKKAEQPAAQLLN